MDTFDQLKKNKTILASGQKTAAEKNISRVSSVPVQTVGSVLVQQSIINNMDAVKSENLSIQENKKENENVDKEDKTELSKIKTNKALVQPSAQLLNKLSNEKSSDASNPAARVIRPGLEPNIQLCMTENTPYLRMASYLS